MDISSLPSETSGTSDSINHSSQTPTRRSKVCGNAQQQLVPDDEEWGKTESVGEFLGAFEEATRSFSADRYPTSHLFLEKVLCIHQALRSQQWQGNQVIRDLAKAMDRKFDKYWDGNYNMALVICTVLDPRKKLDYLAFFYDKVSRNYLDREGNLDLAKDWLTKYYKRYEADLRRDDTSTLSQTGVSRSLLGSPVLVLGKRRLEQEFAEFSSHRRGTSVDKSELDAYLEEALVRDDENFEILSWWKTNSNKYPVLSLMARDFLAIPLSAVSSESAFSLSGSESLWLSNKRHMVCNIISSAVMWVLWKLRNSLCFQGVPWRGMKMVFAMTGRMLRGWLPMLKLDVQEKVEQVILLVETEAGLPPLIQWRVDSSGSAQVFSVRRAPAM